MKQIYVIKDNAVEAYQQPFFVRARGEAVRIFMDECKNPESMLNKHPEDFELWYMGDYDEITGHITANDRMERVSRAIDYLNIQTQ